MNKHTPGPWKICGYWINSKDCSLAILKFPDKGRESEWRHNANLMAAAPDLLEALEAQESAEKYIEEHQGSPFFEETYPKMLDIAYVMRRAAIAKAKGEKS
jgi:hypothetical protein